MSLPTRQEWQQLHASTALDEVVEVPVPNDKYLLDDLLAEIQDLFYLRGQEGDKLLLKKVETVLPESVSARAIADRIKNLQSLNTLFSVDAERYTCQLHDRIDKQVLGAGKQGVVFRVPGWREDVVVKRISVQEHIKDLSRNSFAMFKDPKDGTYKIDYSLIEVAASALANELANSRDSQNFTLFIPRFTAFFACPEMYIVSEFMDSGTFRDFMLARSATDPRTIKVLMFQAIFTLLSLNRMGYIHQDASARNFLVRTVAPGQTYRGLDISRASTWRLVLGDREWLIPNVGFICKLSDFGFMIKGPTDDVSQVRGPYILFDAPSVRRFNGSTFGIRNDVRQGYDIAYFSRTISSSKYHKVNDDFYNAYETSFARVSVPQLKVKPAKGVHVMDSAEHYHTKNGRPVETMWDVDFIGLLDSDFFADILV